MTKQEDLALEVKQQRRKLFQESIPEAIELLTESGFTRHESRAATGWIQEKLESYPYTHYAINYWTPGGVASRAAKWLVKRARVNRKFLLAKIKANEARGAYPVREHPHGVHEDPA